MVVRGAWDSTIPSIPIWIHSLPLIIIRDSERVFLNGRAIRNSDVKLRSILMEYLHFIYSCWYVNSSVLNSGCTPPLLKVSLQLYDWCVCRRLCLICRKICVTRSLYSLICLLWFKSLTLYPCLRDRSKYPYINAHTHANKRPNTDSPHAGDQLKARHIL